MDEIVECQALFKHSKSILNKKNNEKPPVNTEGY